MTQLPRPDDQDNVFFWWRLGHCDPVIAIIENSQLESNKSVALSIISSQSFYALSDFIETWNLIMDENDAKGEDKIDLPESTIEFLQKVAQITKMNVQILSSGRMLFLNQ